MFSEKNNLSTTTRFKQSTTTDLVDYRNDYFTLAFIEKGNPDVYIPE